MIPNFPAPAPRAFSHGPDQLRSCKKPDAPGHGEGCRFPVKSELAQKKIGILRTRAAPAIPRSAPGWMLLWPPAIY